MNLRPPGYEPDELPDCSIPRFGIARRRSTFTGGEPPAIINAEELNFRVRHGNGWILFAVVTALCMVSLNKTIIILSRRTYEHKGFLNILSPFFIIYCKVHVFERTMQLPESNLRFLKRHLFKHHRSIWLQLGSFRQIGTDDI